MKNVLAETWLRMVSVASGELALSVLIALLVYKYYGRFKVRWMPFTLLVLLGWTCCYLIIFLITNDIAWSLRCSENHEDGEEGQCLPVEVLSVVWALLYWLALILTFIVYPLAQDYVRSGHFTIVDRLTDSLKKNFMQYMAMGTFVLVVGAIYCFIAGLSWLRFPAVASSAANAYGLIIFILLLGHGLINVPRRLYRRAGNEMRLARAHFDLTVYTDKADEAQAKLNDIKSELHEIDLIVRPGDPFRPHLERIMESRPGLMDDAPLDLPPRSSFEVSYSNLVRLNEQVHSTIKEWELCEYKRTAALHDAVIMTEVMDRERSCKGRPMLFYRRYLRPPVMYLSSAALILVSILILVSECLFSADGIDLSPLSLFVHYALPLWMPAWAMQGILLLPLLYIAHCTYSSLFQVKIFDYYHLVPGHGSDLASLIFSASYLCRLISPMAYNYMLMLHTDQTAFVAVMGQLDLSSFGSHFQDFLPLLVLPSAAFTLFKIYAKMADMICGRRFQFDERSLRTEQVTRGVLLTRHAYNEYVGDRDSGGGGSDASLDARLGDVAADSSDDSEPSSVI